MRYIKSLQKLYKHKELNYSTLPKQLIKELLDDALITIKRVGANRKKVIAKEEFFKTYDKLKDIESASTRAELTFLNSDSKQKYIAPQEGLFISGNAVVDGKSINLFEDSALFLKNMPKLSPTTLVVVVENFENLIYFKEQLWLFREDDIVFIYRNKATLDFIKELKNEALYFGDFDLYGIKIYLQEIKTRNSNIPFFIPENIKYYIQKYGNKKLYQKQYESTKKLDIKESGLKKLADTIHKCQKTLEQEFFIKGEKIGGKRA